MNKNNQKNKGFTLIELLVVIAIIALLSSVILAGVQTAREKSQISKVKSELEEFVKALEIYRTAYGYYPPSTGCSGGGPFNEPDVCIIMDNYYSITAGYFSPILDELKNKNIYSGDLIATLKSIPKYSGLFLAFTSTPTGINSWVNSSSHGGDPYCNNKPGLVESNEYYMHFHVIDNLSNSILGLSGTYIGNESEGDLYYEGVYCSPIR